MSQNLVPGDIDARVNVLRNQIENTIRLIENNRLNEIIDERTNFYEGLFINRIPLKPAYPLWCKCNYYQMRFELKYIAILTEYRREIRTSGRGVLNGYTIWSKHNYYEMLIELRDLALYCIIH